MHTSLSTNSLTFSDITDGPDVLVAVYPSSAESGAASIGTYGNLATLLNLDDVAALRDLLTTCLVQAGREPHLRGIADLMSEEGENVEYDRACVEIARDLFGFDDRETAEAALRSARP